MAAILQSIADYVCQLERERNTLLEESRNQFNSSTRQPRQLDASNVQADKNGDLENPAPKRKRLETVVDSMDEGIGSSSPRSENGEDIRQEIIELRIQLKQERELRRLREEQVRHLQCLVYAAEDETLDDTMVLQHHNPEDKFDALSGMNPGLETAFGSPHSQNSSQDMESSYELSLRESSPELSNTEVPEDLSGKNSSITFSYVSEFADMNMNAAVASSPISVDHSHFPVDVRPAKQSISTSRQNLETIVEAIRHVEGDHMFRDDPILPNLESRQSKKPDNSAAVEEYYLEQNQKCTNANLNKDLSFQHQIIRNAPLTQSRPGVIVPNIP